ncbi:hypothetical protein L1987_81243 [Smallanthus sonchifolius]|uniref:Uncharacterized protein n=1 Tax=Smallanthus sonchifolius TaxID=185202 RepID=A0ACB8YQ22_9ASTR|nr:hypothetical protein L1987_81243 [Smallanthus sonchifolius]
MGDDRTNRIHWPSIDPGRLGVWPGGIGGLALSDVLNKKILHVFCNAKSFPLKRIIFQFWRPITIRNKRLLSCDGNPYASSHVNLRLSKYRSACCRYGYSIDDYDVSMTISGAPPSTAFLNHIPEVVLDLSLHRGTPLVDLALECELTCFMMLPVFDETSTSCVGVIEVSMRLPGLVVIFNELNRELKRVGLRIIPPRPIWRPSKIITSGFQLALREIAKALKLFFRDVRVLPLKKGEDGLIGRTLETHQPHLCRNIYKLSDIKGISAVLFANTMCASFVICLRSSHTGQCDYAFEFFWPKSRNHLALMEDLLLTLREYLPSFKNVSGAQLGDELLVVDVENSSSGSGSGSTSVKIFPRNKLSKTPKNIEGTRALRSMKRKPIEGQSELNQANQFPLTNINNPKGEDDDVVVDDDDLIILAVYKVDYSLFFLPSSTTFENVMERIKQEFELNPAGTYKINYQVLPGEWYSLTDDTCLKSCISSYRTSKNIDYIKLYVLAVEN